jgi:CDP-paratose synthetase
MKKTLLITGGNGFLGSNLVKSLIKDYNIIILENKNSNFSNLQTQLGQITSYRYEIDSFNKIFTDNKINFVLHTAADYGRSEEYSFVPDTNLIMPLKLLESSIQNKVECFINTDTVLDRFVSDYALSKNHFREWLIIKQNNIKAVNIKLEHFYGPGAGKNNFITMMMNRLLSNEKEIELTFGEQIRDFVYYKDVVEAYLIILNNISVLPHYSEFQVASGQLIKLKDLVELMKNLTGSTSELIFGAVPYRQNELMKSESDNTKLLQLGWQPKFTINEGLKEVVVNEKKVSNK